MRGTGEDEDDYGCAQHRDANSLQESIGVLCADIPEDLFSSILDRVASRNIRRCS